jgi:hypothetical protein
LEIPIVCVFSAFSFGCPLALHILARTRRGSDFFDRAYRTMTSQLITPAAPNSLGYGIAQHPDASPSSITPPHIKQYVVLWPLFFLICFGLGYPTLNRYDLRSTNGVYDSRAYYALVTGTLNAELQDYSQRLLVPWVARPFYWMARGHVGTWDPVSFGLLVSNSLFLATAAFLVVNTGCTVLGDYGTALLAGMLYLLNFAAGNYHLAGLVDSSQACLMVAVTKTLLTEKWRWLVVWGFIGAFTKETSVPLCVAFAVGWWFASSCRNGFQWRMAFWIGGMGTIGFAALTTLMFVVSPYLPWSFAIAQRSNSSSPYSYLTGVLDCFFNRQFLYVFVWLLPLGLWRLKAFPRPWVFASLAGVLASVAMGAYSAGLGNTVRPMLNVAGPLLTVSTALFLSKLTAKTRANSSSNMRLT